MNVVLGADLLFFEQSHDGLLGLLGRMLAGKDEPYARTGQWGAVLLSFPFFCFGFTHTEGTAFLLQPSRGGALERFVARAEVEVEMAVGGAGRVWEVTECGLVEEGAVGEEDGLRLLQLRRRRPKADAAAPPT